MEQQVKERRVRLRRTTLANTGLFLFSAVISAASGNRAFMAEAIHDAADTAAHGSRYVAETRGIDQHSKAFRRYSRASMFILSSLSAWTAVRLGVDIYHGTPESYDATRQFLELSGSVVLAAGNVYAFDQMNAIEEHSHASHDSHHHARTDMIASVGLSACIAADTMGLNGASEWGGAAFATYTAYELFPTEERMHAH